MGSSKERPKLDIPRTRVEWVWDILGYTAFIGIIILLIIIWGKLPEEVPAHYNAKGEVDRWGSKWELTILPLVSFFQLIFIQALEHFPEIHNYPKRFNESNAKAFYLNSRKMINQMKNTVLIVFSLICFESIAIALNWYDGFGSWFLPVIISAIFIPMIISLIKRRNIR